jgi:hypothetical protein
MAKYLSGHHNGEFSTWTTLSSALPYHPMPSFDDIQMTMNKKYAMHADKPWYQTVVDTLAKIKLDYLTFVNSVFKAREKNKCSACFSCQIRMWQNVHNFTNAMERLIAEIEAVMEVGSYDHHADVKDWVVAWDTIKKEHLERHKFDFKDDEL